jgi:hypothetical protein
MTVTTTFFNRSDPRQPTDAEIYSAAKATSEHFAGDLGRTRD